MSEKILFIKDFILALTIIVALNVGIRYIFAQKSVFEFLDKWGITPIGTKEILFLSLSALVIGFFTRDFIYISDPLIYFAITAPFIGLFNILLNKQPIRETIADIPVVGDYLTCPLATDKKVNTIKAQMKAHGIEQSEIDKIQRCYFTCPHCRGLDAVKIIAVWSLANIIVPWFFYASHILK